jgi:hypothetical protein
VNDDYLIAPRFGFTKDILMKIQPAAIALLSLAMQSARAEETASMSGKLMLTNEDVRSVA